MSPIPAPLRPRDFALLVLATGDAAPRQRARDQQADRAGLALKHRVLHALIPLDPEPDAFAATLLAIVEQFGPPTGPTRAIVSALFDEWHAVSQSPECLNYLVHQATQPPAAKAARHGRQLPG